MSDTEEREEALGGQEGPVGAGSDESVGAPGPVVEGLDEGLAAAGLEQGDRESSSGEESEIGTEEEDEEEEEEEEEAAELGEPATGVDQHHFQMVNFHFMYLDLVPSLLRPLYQNGHVLMRARGHVSRHLRQGTPSESHSMPELSASLPQGLHLPLAVQRPALSFALDLNLDLPVASLPPQLHELPELPQVLPTIQAIEAARPTVLAIEAAMPADLTEALEPSKPIDQADAVESREPTAQATASQEMTQYLHENADEEGQKSGGEEEKEAKGEKDKENKEQEPE
ncbi:cancer/testis antigen 47B-like, partial [Echinops telfairi]|uniref:Cancer/testis antigen 47B-like n=1 Tax=Echinops telfairi TaxID=9371 RepID=A0ABM0ZSZ1_ECHTE